MLTLESLQRVLGGTIMNGQLSAPGPGHSARDNSMSVALSPNHPGGFVVNPFSPKDDPIACRDYIKRRLGIDDRQPSRRSAAAAAAPVPAKNDDADRTRRAVTIWNQALDPRGTIAETYLNSRGLDLPDDLAGSVLRFHPSCPFGRGERKPCLIAAFHSIKTGNLVAIHRIALTPDGRKINRLMLGPVGGAAIKLDDHPEDGGSIAVGEGIETCLAARMAGIRPVWAVGSAGGITRFPVLQGATAIAILAEHDETGANQEAVQVAGDRWHAAGREVHILLPTAGNDINDALLAKGVDAAIIPSTFVPTARPEPRGVVMARALDPSEVVASIDEDGAITQDFMAQVFAGHHAGKLKYCHHTGAWFEWTGRHWRRDETELAYYFVRELCRRLTEGAPKEDIRTARRKSFCDGVEAFAQADRVFAVTSDHWDRDPYLMGTPGGTVDLRTGILRESDQADGITKLTAVAPSPAADCARWLQFLSETFSGDAEIIRFVQQWAGYSLTADTSEHALVFGYGSGGNGKSVFLNAITGIMADYAATASMDTFTASQSERHPTDLAMLRGARLVTASETEEGRAWAESRIKQMTGGDPITARFMRQDFFTFRPSFKLMIVGNHRPVLKSVDDAARRRFNLVPFLLKPANPDRQLEEKLKAEWPGILRWMIDGCLDWQANGLIRPKSVIAATQAYFAEQDVIGQWLDEECDADPGNNWWEAGSTALYLSWTEFAHKAGESPGTQKALSGILLKRGFEKCTLGNAGLKGFRGIRVKSKARRDDD